MRENGNNLLEGHAGKPFQELINGGACFQVFEKCSHGYTTPFENPCPADFVWHTLYFLAITPIEHAVHAMLAQRSIQEDFNAEDAKDFAEDAEGNFSCRTR